VERSNVLTKLHFLSPQGKVKAINSLRDIGLREGIAAMVNESSAAKEKRGHGGVEE
jgi:hypothetical protein